MKLKPREIEYVQAFIRHNGEWEAFRKEMDLSLYIAQEVMKEISRKLHIYHRERQNTDVWIARLQEWVKGAEEFRQFELKRDPMSDPAF